MPVGGATVVPEAGTVINGECVVTSTLTSESVQLELTVRRVSYTTVPCFEDDMTCDSCYCFNILLIYNIYIYIYVFFINYLFYISIYC